MNNRETITFTESKQKDYSILLKLIEILENNNIEELYKNDINYLYITMNQVNNGIIPTNIINLFSCKDVREVKIFERQIINFMYYIEGSKYLCKDFVEKILKIYKSQLKILEDECYSELYNFYKFMLLE